MPAKPLALTSRLLQAERNVERDHELLVRDRDHADPVAVARLRKLIDPLIEIWNPG